MTDDLKPYPFCGCRAKIKEKPCKIYDGAPWYYVECGRSSCRARTSAWGQRAQAIISWNKRADE